MWTWGWGPCGCPSVPSTTSLLLLCNVLTTRVAPTFQDVPLPSGALSTDAGEVSTGCCAISLARRAGFGPFPTFVLKGGNRAILLKEGEAKQTLLHPTRGSPPRPMFLPGGVPVMRFRLLLPQRACWQRRLILAALSRRLTLPRRAW